MTVQQLIDLLTDLDTPDATVHIMSQKSYPFENSVSGLAVREDFTECDEDEDELTLMEGDPSDVFLLEGSQLRYGSKAAWDARR